MGQKRKDRQIRGGRFDFKFVYANGESLALQVGLGTDPFILNATGP